ncbi:MULTISPECIES: NADH-quinone oxidoreductase subunit D [Actinomycetaceae]|jgi:NADH dehydrogenase subunit D|uniref:NADH-quinone oxidoreductase subunit D n=1 Tax=Actinomycetaceae TaxID=2049 RepID=UPI0003960891|nr:NADH-quinone oxidoreductase subunit D [Actinobaculum sp. oral taxon 183]ERH15176.1 NADH dehydrogenase subunit D [Actinobaculum sp. oral taxon 183 str. F0552]RKV68775.1 MAG: NADH-quinone oxidoreductase subunit D [Actinomyces sp.]
MSANFHATGGATEEELDGLPNFTAVGGDWNEISDEAAQMAEERIVVNLGPVHPSTHGVYRLLIELDGEYVREIRGATGFLHTGIEKNMEYRTWTQGVAYVTRMDYVASFFQEVGYCLAVERLLGIEGDVPRRASQIRVLLMELQRIASHLVAVGSALNELGATTMMTIAFRTREDILRIFERISGLRMNNEFVRPGGVLEDVPEGTTDYIRGLLPNIRRGTAEMEDIVAANPIFKARFQDVGVLSLSALMALGQTGPGLKAAGLAWDLRKSQPYCGYEDYEFDVPVRDKSDAYNRAMIRFEECYQSLRIVYQALDLLDASQGEPVMVADKKIAWPARLSIATDGQGTAPEHVREIMAESMEALIHHFKLVTEGFRVPAGQAFAMVEHAKGVWGCHIVSSGGTRPYRVHVCDPGFHNLQGLSMMAEGGLLADAIVCLASIDPVMGGVDR